MHAKPSATPKGGGILRQPMSVWATAFAAVVAFMGIGLVDPILPAIAVNLDASPSQVSLLFTSYFLITAVAMLVPGWVSSRIGGKKTRRRLLRSGDRDPRGAAPPPGAAGAGRRRPRLPGRPRRGVTSRHGKAPGVSQGLSRVRC
jgi:hypothetical protein